MLVRMLSNMNTLTHGWWESKTVKPLWNSDSLEISYKTKYTLIIPSSNYAPWYLLKSAENLYPYKNEAQMSTATIFITDKCESYEDVLQQVNELTAVHPVNGIKFIAKKEWAIKSSKDVKET